MIYIVPGDSLHFAMGEISEIQVLYNSTTSLWSSDNTINFTSPEHLSESLYSYGERIFVAITWALITLFGTVGNSLVIAAVLFSQKLRTATNVFVVNLAVADFLTSLFLTWSVVALLGRHGWPIPDAEWLCSAGGFMIFLCTGVSLYNLAAIALNRLVLITQSFDTYKKIYTPVNITLMAAMIWFIPLAIFISLPLAGIGGFGYDKQHSTCSDLDHHPQNETFQLAQTILFYPIPLITIVVSYALVFRHMRRHFKRQRSMHELSDIATISSSKVSSSESFVVTNMTMMTVVEEGLPQGQSSPKSVAKSVAKSTRRSQRIDEMEVEITKNLFLVVCAFFLFFSPYFIALFIPGSNYFLLYLGISVLSNSIINPVIYAKRHPHFKVVFRCLLTCRYSEIPEPSDTLKRLLFRKSTFYH